MLEYYFDVLFFVNERGKTGATSLDQGRGLFAYFKFMQYYGAFEL
jgi:hypothetical protein